MMRASIESGSGTAQRHDVGVTKKREPKPVDPKDVEIGERIREARKKRGLTVAQLAHAMSSYPDAIVHSETISRYENGRMNAAKALPAIARVLEIPLSWFYYGDEGDPYASVEVTHESVHDETLSDEDYAIEGVRRDLGPLETAEVEFLRSEFQAAQFSVGRLESEMAISRLKSKLREYRGKLPPPERERVEEPKRAKGESIRDAVLGKGKPRGR